MSWSSRTGLPVEDRLAVHELLALHGHLVDQGELDVLGLLFTPDVVYDVSAMGGTVLRGVAAVREAALALGDDNPVAHHVTNVVLETDPDRDSVRASSKGLAVRGDGRVDSVTYADVVVRTPQGWRISERVVRPRRRPLTPG